ncbi:MAG: hypothetical protein RLZZ360_770 [Candidatus Parcubacteria bacterium]|jgi:prepilin signal peptidase PulO-like enzyme (type II secretory pathway)
MISVVAMLPGWSLALIAFGFGIIIGSFLNVVIYRFHTGKSIRGSSHCLSCQTDLRWYELLPIISYVALRGRCNTCSARIPSRYLWVELCTGILFVLVVMTTSLWYWLLGFFLVSLLVVVAVYDVYHMVIPTLLITELWVVAILFTLLDYWFSGDSKQILMSIAAALLSYGFFALLWYVSKGRWIGYGDAKLAAPLGFLVGLAGAFSMIVLSFWVGTIISLSLIWIQTIRQKRGQSTLRFYREPLTIKSEVPFAPFLIIAFILVYFLTVDVLNLITYVLPM